jgi:hypothetical protein
MLTRKTLLRPLLLPNGTTDYTPLRVCDCGDERRGPAGGVCGNCGGAIPDAEGK